jgi:hypothetical protein
MIPAGSAIQPSVISCLLTGCDLCSIQLSGKKTSGWILSLHPGVGVGLAHDPEKWVGFSEKIMLKQKDRAG